LLKKKVWFWNINGKNDIGGISIITGCGKKQDIQLVQLLMNYAKENNIILDMNKKVKN